MSLILTCFTLTVSSNSPLISSWTVVATAGMALVVIAFLIISIIRFRAAKYKQRIIALEQKLLLSQMNPHFVFNSLTAIQSYIFRNDPYQAGKYLANFAKLVRLILENSRLEFITIAKEKETINHYLELQNLRFGDKFEYTIIIDPDIDEEHHNIPPMLAQPFIENAIEHGIIHVSIEASVQIRFKLIGSSILLEVEDNGVGIEQSAKFNQKKRDDHQSLATRITHERIKNLRKAYGKSIKMSIIDLTKKTDAKRGTLVSFLIPAIHN
ncbi:MAG: sensor histidine kinase [Bacteroidales bacterium]